SHQPRQRERATGDERNVLTRDREQVIEARCAEALSELVRQAAVVTEHDAFEDGGTLTVEPARDGAAEPAAQAVGNTAESAATSYLLPRIEPKDRVDAKPLEPRS